MSAIQTIPLEWYLLLSTVLFTIGVLGVLFRRNAIIIFMSIELMLLAVNINFVAFSVEMQDIVGQVFSIIILSIAAAEISIGLAILVLYFRNRDSIEIEDVNQMKG